MQQLLGLIGLTHGVSTSDPKSWIFVEGAIVPKFHVGEYAPSHVKNYAYLLIEVTLHECLFKSHVDELLHRGEHKIGACTFGTNSANLPLSFVESILFENVCALKRVSALILLPLSLCFTPSNRWGRLLLCCGPSAIRMARH